MAVTDLSKSELVSRVQRASNQLKNIKKEASEIAARTVDGAVNLAGATASGVIRGWNENGEPVMVPGTEVPADLAFGGLLMVVGITGMGGEASRPLGSLGAGLAAGGLASSTSKMIRKARAEGKF